MSSILIALLCSVYSSRKVLFGKADAFDEIGGSFQLKDFENDHKSPIPQIGSVITVTGVCSSTPHIQGNVATLFIRDDPQGVASFYNKIKIVITGCERNKNEIDRLSKKVNTNMHVGVKGRVEKLVKEDDVVYNDGYKMLKFKLIIDSDDHALFSLETKPPKLTRQLSQCWWPLHALSENGNELNLKVGEFIIDNDLERVYCAADTADDQILEYVVAFKNSFDGEIFVGVKENGEITGMEVDNGEIKKWCEEISKAIGNLLPEANEGADICQNIKEANELIDRNRCFVCLLPLCNDSSRTIGWIHVPKGEATVYFRKASDVHAYKRVGAETKRINNYQCLFDELKSLAKRQIEPFEKECDGKDDEQDDERNKLQEREKYRVLQKIKHENQHHELKMIFGDNPAKTIQEKYLAPYACGFLNADGGSIFFGIQEDEKSKMGRVVGIVLSTQERKAVIETTVETLRNFYPPVSSSQFHIKFHSVCVPTNWIVKDKGGNLYAIITGPSEEVGKKWPKFIRNKLPAESRSAAIPIGSKRFCVVATKQTLASENLTQLVEQFVKANSKFKLQRISETELSTILKTVVVIELNVTRSPYPIHMTKTIETCVFTKDKGHLRTSKLSLEDLMCRFEIDSTSEFNVDKFLEHNNFDNTKYLYILVASPFDLPENERDLYGLVIPKWTLTIDLDEEPKQTGHLFQLFEKLKDHYKIRRDLFLQTLQDSNLNFMDPDQTIWLAARGYRKDGNSLGDQSHENGNKTQRPPLDLLYKYVKAIMKAKRLNVVVLWDEGQHQTLFDVLRKILKDLMYLDGTVITFVCATPKARLNISGKIIKPLHQEGYWDTISEDRVYVAPPYVLARFLSLYLPSPHRPEDDYQVPHKKFFSSGGSLTIPQILPQQLRQNLSGFIKVMYLMKEKKLNGQTLNMERRNFLSGSAITREGLLGNIAIRRTKMNDLEKKFNKVINNNNVSYISARVDHGAGSTTMCLQFLHEQHKFYPCAQLTKLKDDLEHLIQEINKKTRLPLILFVEDNISLSSQDFLEFRENVERLDLNVIFIFIEHAEIFSCSESEMRTSTQKYRTKTSPDVPVELRQSLDENEMEQLIKVLAVLEKGKEKELLKFKEDAQKDGKPRTFAHFRLLAFGSKFECLNQYVKFRLNRAADERQENILAFLSLTHVFTDSSLPENALVPFLNKESIKLEEELQDKYLQELLSPRTGKKNDSRRISSVEVAREILQQLSKANPEDAQYWKFIKSVCVTMARHILSKSKLLSPNYTRKINRLTRKLFVTSEHEDEDFSPLIRKMRVSNCNTARDTLKELVEIFDEKDRHSTIRAHLRAHLAKYHMMEYKDFVEAKQLIEAAIDEQREDSLLHHIHGDIIHQQVLVLKGTMKKKEDMETILSHAVESSKCFEFVRSKKPHMSHGYISDAMVRITVMQAGIELMRGENISFVDYLIEAINEIKLRDHDNILSNSRYLLSLIFGAHDCLDEGCIEFGQKRKWKEIFLRCIGDLTNLTRLCDKIKEEKNCSSFTNCSTWLDEILVQTQILHHALEIETNGLGPEEIGLKFKKMAEYDLHSKFRDRLMKFWIRYSRKRLIVPDLQIVKTKVNLWSNKMEKKFYK